LLQPPANMPGRIGRYQVQERLGEGSMSVVYKAFDADISRHLAIKLLRPEVAMEPEFRSRFLSEARAAGNLAHPNIVTIYDIGECELGPYIAMELVQGPTLEEAMAEDARPSLRQILDIGVQLADALGYAHSRGIVHRDVKPGNIMQLPDGHTIRITDFGIAHIESPDRMHHTVSGTILGTPQYMSPEQIEGGAVDGRSDLFSVGVILYQLLTGKRPFVAQTLASLYAKIVREPPEPMGDQMPAGVRKLVERLLQKDPARRFADGRELGDALRSLIEDMDAHEQRQAEARRLPLRVRFTVILALLVTLSMGVAAYVVHRVEVSVMTSLALDFGTSLARFVSIRSAEPMLLKDWIAVEFFVTETQRRQQITYLHLVDRDGIVRGSTDPETQGLAYAAPPVTRSLIDSDDLQVHALERDGLRLLDFEVPILYLGKTMGRVHLGLSRAPLDEAATLTLYTMLGLLVAIVLTVIVVAYLLAGRITAPLKVLRSALVQASRGHLTHRINERRDDEIGELFEVYNRMADALTQQRDELATRVRAASTLPPAAPRSADTPQEEGATRILTTEQARATRVTKSTGETAE
jgi:HAMP domain-containing protein